MRRNEQKAGNTGSGKAVYLAFSHTFTTLLQSILCFQTIFKCSIHHFLFFKFLISLFLWILFPSNILFSFSSQPIPPSFRTMSCNLIVFFLYDNTTTDLFHVGHSLLYSIHLLEALIPSWFSLFQKRSLSNPFNLLLCLPNMPNSYFQSKQKHIYIAIFTSFNKH